VERELQRLHVPMPQRLYFFLRPDVASLRDCVNAGAAGCLDKEASPETVLRAIRSVGSGLFAVDPALLMQAMAGTPEVREPAVPESPPGDWSQLTERQREIVRWAAQGLSNKQIARHLGISPETVKSHLHHVFERAGVSGRMALLAVRWADSEAEASRDDSGSGDSGSGDSGTSPSGSNGENGGSGRRDVA
jgi:DNA-binding NarL/FixJ family response regulator